MRTQSLKVSLLLLSVVLAGFSIIRPALAASPNPVSLGIAPIDYTGQYFDLTMAPGELRELKVEVANHGAKPTAARTYAADVYTIINGGFGVRLDGEPATGTTTWLAYPSETVDLPADKGLTRSFTVSVPPNAGPGDYITSLVVQNAGTTPGGSGGVEINQVQRQVIAVAITVPGPRKPALAIGSIAHQYLSAKSIVSATLTNDGNVRLKPSGELVVSQSDGREVSRFPITMDSVYAGDTTSIEVPFDKALIAGDYRVSLTLNYEGGSASADDVPLNVPKPTLAEAGGAPSAAGQLATVNQPPAATDASTTFPLVVLTGGVALALIVALIFVWRRRRRSVVAGPAGPDLTPRGGLEPGVASGRPQFDARPTPIHSPSVLPPTQPLRPVATAAGERQGVPLRPASWAREAAPEPRPLERQPYDAANLRCALNAAPSTSEERNPPEVSRLDRFFGPISASAPPSPDSDVRP